MMTQLRTNLHELHRKPSKWTLLKIPLENIICNQCNLEDIEDEAQFLLRCP